MAYSSVATATRAWTKASGIYRCGWDLIDACASGKVKLEELTADQLPEPMQEMTAEERVAYIEEMEERRGGIQTEIQNVTAQRNAFVAEEKVDTPAPAAMLLKLRGIGPEFAATLYAEGLFRHFDNRRQVAAYAGLAPTPWQSGSINREQGVSKAGNPRLRTTMVQLAWLWLRHQPDSTLSRWFHERVARNGGRFRKTAITALARKLLVALWKYVTAGVFIEGAILKAD